MSFAIISVLLFENLPESLLIPATFKVSINLRISKTSSSVVKVKSNLPFFNSKSSKSDKKYWGKA